LATLQTCGLLIRVAKPSYTTGTLSEIKNGRIFNYLAPPSMAVLKQLFENICIKRRNKIIVLVNKT
jgi:hypothetical protein